MVLFFRCKVTVEEPGDREGDKKDERRNPDAPKKTEFSLLQNSH